MMIEKHRAYPMARRSMTLLDNRRRVMRTREELVELLLSVVDNEEQWAADKIMDIREILEEER
jgi:hypothetical protein